MTDRKWPALTPEQRQRTVNGIERDIEDGFIQPKFVPSLLGLEWECFSTQEFTKRPERPDWIDPPEFAPIAFSILDAYSATLLSSGFEFEPEEPVSFRGRLTRFHEGPTMIELWIETPRWPLDMSRNSNEIRNAFRDFLGAQGFEEAKTQFLWMEGPGCSLAICYPGKLETQKSPFLRSRPVEEWPCASLSIRVTEGLRSRARDVLEFVRSKPKANVVPN